MTPCFFIICRDDDKEDGTPGEYVLATRKTFATREEAEKLAAPIAPGRLPIVVEAPRGMTYPDPTPIPNNLTRLGNPIAPRSFQRLDDATREAKPEDFILFVGLGTRYVLSTDPLAFNDGAVIMRHPTV
jgi:hypothetical protein